VVPSHLNENSRTGHVREKEIMKPFFPMLSHGQIPGGKESYRF